MALLVLLLGLAPARAEVGVVVRWGEYRGFIMMGPPTEDPWPFPIWNIVRSDADPSFLLNILGDQNQDGPAASAIDPQTNLPVVAWARYDSGARQIVVSEWTGATWSPPTVVSEDKEDNRDPAITVDEHGIRRIVWWRSGGSSQILYADRDARKLASGGEPEADVVDLGGWPDIAHWRGVTRVAYQRSHDKMTEVILAERVGQPWMRTRVAETSYAGPTGNRQIHIKIHATERALWIDWVNDDGVLAYSVLDPATGAWSAPHFVPYSWDEASGVTEWTAREMGRVAIRALVNR